MAITVILLDAGSGESSHQSKIQKNVPKFHKLYVFVCFNENPREQGLPAPGSSLMLYIY